MIIASAKCCAVWAYRSCAEPRADEDLVHLESTINGFLEVGGIALHSLYLHMILSDPYIVYSPLPSLNAPCEWLTNPSIRAEPPHLCCCFVWLQAVFSVARVPLLEALLLQLMSRLMWEMGNYHRAFLCQRCAFKVVSPWRMATPRLHRLEISGRPYHHGLRPLIKCPLPSSSCLYQCLAACRGLGGRGQGPVGRGAWDAGQLGPLNLGPLPGSSGRPPG